MKTWIIVLLIGIGILFVAFIIQMSEPFGLGGMSIAVLGIALIIGAIVAAARRLMRRMLND